MEEKERKDESQEHNGVPAQTQQSGLRGERRDSGMNELSPEGGSERYGACPDEGYTPASFEKRAAAWMGVAYMLMLLFILNFTLFTGGRQLPGTFPLFLISISAAVIVITIHRLRTQELPAAVKCGCVLMLITCTAGIFLGLALGVPSLLAALGV